MATRFDHSRLDDLGEPATIAPAKPGANARALPVSPAVQPPTEFASAERASAEELDASIAALARHPLLQTVLDVAGVSIAVLNKHRQILYANGHFLAEAGGGDSASFVGQRAGEAFGCIHARQRPGGCGTASACSSCGSVLAVLTSQRARGVVERDCFMSVVREEMLQGRELKVRASRLEIDGEEFTVLAMRDMSADKRREALESVFLHDVGNTISGLQGWLRTLENGTHDREHALARIRLLADRLCREIEDHRTLMEAENGSLELKLSAVDVHATLDTAAATLDGHPLARRRQLEIRRGALTGTIVTDESLLVRILVNMLKNALEATPEDGVVKAWADVTADGVEVRVWNEGTMPPAVATQVFKRSFTTKPGGGRGLGTFSMKLFGEHYLRGQVGFESAAGAGTTFFIRLPRK
ncbi:MAG: HAMP domain-containing histidine kinase [Deltaproteobacteria bacterium]|nr:HAMP domain-containing histidine kinase [Deltaproteobacteria bacterium]